VGRNAWAPKRAPTWCPDQSLHRQLLTGRNRLVLESAVQLLLPILEPAVDVLVAARVEQLQAVGKVHRAFLPLHAGPHLNRPLAFFVWLRRAVGSSACWATELGGGKPRLRLGENRMTLSRLCFLTLTLMVLAACGSSGSGAAPDAAPEAEGVGARGSSGSDAAGTSSGGSASSGSSGGMDAAPDSTEPVERVWRRRAATAARAPHRAAVAREQAALALAAAEQPTRAAAVAVTRATLATAVAATAPAAPTAPAIRPAPLRRGPPSRAGRA
jgi:hypothetical protein